MRFHRHSGAVAVLFAFLAAGAATPRTVSAQDAGSSISQERLTRFATAHIAIAAARDEFHGQVARVHDEEGRLRAREEIDAKIAEILEANDMTQDEYDQLILRISLDGELRARFEEVVAQLQQDPGGG